MCKFAGDREAKAGPRGSFREVIVDSFERLEHSLRSGCGDARTFIGDGEGKCVAIEFHPDLNGADGGVLLDVG